MTDTTKSPSDEEISAVWDEHIVPMFGKNGINPIVFARAVLARWGAQPAGEPVAWMWQHDETGRTGFVDRWQVQNGWQVNNPRLKLVRPLVFGDTAPQPAPVREPQPMPDLSQLTKRGAEAWAGVDVQALREGGITKGVSHG